MSLRSESLISMSNSEMYGTHIVSQHGTLGPLGFSAYVDKRLERTWVQLPFGPHKGASQEVSASLPGQGSQRISQSGVWFCGRCALLEGRVMGKFKVYQN